VHFTPAIRNVSIDINEGSYTIFSGPTGSGKSTLLSLLAGIIYPTKGEVVLDDVYVSYARDEIVSNFREKFIGYVPQDTLLVNELTVLENVIFPNVFMKKKITDLRSYALLLLKKLGLYRKLNNMPYELSGGEMKKVMVARALVKKPMYLFADEPFSELDAESKAIILGLLDEQHSQGSAVILASHTARPSSRIADCYVLKRGMIAGYTKEVPNESRRSAVQTRKMRRR
jgi:putative ABC transport system ATP-binding protein